MRRPAKERKKREKKREKRDFNKCVVLFSFEDNPSFLHMRLLQQLKFLDGRARRFWQVYHNPLNQFLHELYKALFQNNSKLLTLFLLVFDNHEINFFFCFQIFGRRPKKIQLNINNAYGSR